MSTIGCFARKPQTLRPWIAENAINELPDDIAEWVRDSFDTRHKPTSYSERILHTLNFGKQLEDRVLDAGIKLYYDLVPTAVCVDRRVSAVVFCSKGGLVGVHAETVVDCTRDARVAALADATFAERIAPGGLVAVSYSMFGEGVETLAVCEDDDVSVHGPYLELTTTFSHKPGSFASGAHDLNMRLYAIDLLQTLKQIFRS